MESLTKSRIEGRVIYLKETIEMMKKLKDNISFLNGGAEDNLKMINYIVVSAFEDINLISIWLKESCLALKGADSFKENIEKMLDLFPEIFEENNKKINLINQYKDYYNKGLKEIEELHDYYKNSMISSIDN